MHILLDFDLLRFVLLKQLRCTISDEFGYLCRFSVKIFGEIDDWTQGQLVALAEKAKIVWGSSDLWDKAQVSEIGNIIREY